MDNFYNKHYIRIDADNNIIDGWSDGPHPRKDTTGAICINEQGSYHFWLFTPENENLSLFNTQGIYLYRYIGGVVIAKTLEEIQTEIDALPKPQPSMAEEALGIASYVGMMTGVL